MQRPNKVHNNTAPNATNWTKTKNFRAYQDEQHLRVDKLTALIGRNDVGKSTIFEALGAFFDHPLCKVETSDRCVHSSVDADIEISCIFDELPERLVLDEAVETTLRSEHLINENGHLEIKKRYAGEKLKSDIYAVAWHPTDARARDLLLKKNADLKRIAEDAGVPVKDRRSNVELRAAIRGLTKPSPYAHTEIPLNKEGAKEIWGALAPHLPLFALFRSDRPSTDDDDEVQDPMRLAVKQALLEVGPELRAIQKKGRRTRNRSRNSNPGEDQRN